MLKYEYYNDYSIIDIHEVEDSDSIYFLLQYNLLINEKSKVVKFKMIEWTGEELKYRKPIFVTRAEEAKREFKSSIVLKNVKI